MYIVFVGVVLPAVFYETRQNDIFIAFISHHLAASEESLLVDAVVYHLRESFIVRLQTELWYPHIAC